MIRRYVAIVHEVGRPDRVLGRYRTRALAELRLARVRAEITTIPSPREPWGEICDVKTGRTWYAMLGYRIVPARTP